MTLPFILQMDAVVVLRPDLVEKMFRGELTLADTRAEMHESYWNKAMSENNIEKAQGSSYIAECQNLHLEKES